MTLEENCFDRSWPGTGEFPLIEIVRTLADMDALRQVSPEVFSPHNATRSAAKIAALSSASLHALLDAANIAYSLPTRQAPPRLGSRAGTWAAARRTGTR